MAKRTPPDWEGIEKEFRSGQLSVREIARRYGLTDTAIRKKAKENLWVRDLAQEVRIAVRTKLVRSEVRKDDASDLEIVEAAAERGAEVVRLHRNDVAKLREIELRLLAELGDEENPPTKVHITSYQGVVTQTVLGIAVTERISALQALAFAQHKRIQLERQAYNLDGKDGDNPFDAMSEDQIAQRIEELEAKFKGRSK